MALALKWLAVGLPLAGWACAGTTEGRSVGRCAVEPCAEPLASSVALQVGSTALSAEAMRRVAEQARRPSSGASRPVGQLLDELAQKAFLAEALRHWDQPSASWLQRVALAHSLTHQLASEARAKGEVTTQELDGWTKHNWIKVARPASARTIHAVVLVDENASAEKQAQAAALAERVRVAVVDVPDAEVFRKRVDALDHDGFEVRVEELLPVTADGRIVRLDAPAGSNFGRYEESFAQAANALNQIGETSSVVHSSFGYHVLRLLEKVQASERSETERREMAYQDVLNHRARGLLQAVVDGQTAALSVTRERSAEEATARVQVDR